MKKLILTGLLLSISTLSFAATTNVVKLTGKLGDASESGDSFAVKTTKGDLWLYTYGLSEKDADTLYKARKKKSCVKVVESDSKTTVTEVTCPKKLKSIKQ